MTAVFVTNYEMTMGTVIGINELGIHMPRELSVIGFDNLEFARACSPQLTIVSQPTEGIAKETARIMLSRLGVEGEIPETPVIAKASDPDHHRQIGLPLWRSKKKWRLCGSLLKETGGQYGQTIFIGD